MCIRGKDKKNFCIFACLKIVRPMKKFCVKTIRLLMKLLAKLPLKFHYFCGDVLSWFVKNVVQYRTGLVWTNISRAFPEKKYWQLKRIYNDFYRHFGEIFAETIWFADASYKKLHEAGIVTVKNPEEFNEIYLNSPSVTILCSHCGHWEILGGFWGYMTKDPNKKYYRLLLNLGNRQEEGKIMSFTTYIPGHSVLGYYACSYGIIVLIALAMMLLKSWKYIVHSIVVRDKYLLFRLYGMISVTWHFLFSPISHFKWQETSTLAIVIVMSLTAIKEYNKIKRKNESKNLSTNTNLR